MENLLLPFSFCLSLFLILTGQVADPATPVRNSIFCTHGKRLNAYPKNALLAPYHPCTPHYKNPHTSLRVVGRAQSSQTRHPFTVSASCQSGSACPNHFTKYFNFFPLPNSRESKICSTRNSSSLYTITGGGGGIYR